MFTPQQITQRKKAKLRLIYKEYIQPYALSILAAFAFIIIVNIYLIIIN